MEEVIMPKIIRYIIVVFVIILICIIGVTIVVKKNNKIVKNSHDENISYIEYEDYNELALKLAEKNGDWSRYRLCENFRKKYNEKDGIFGKMQFDKVEYKPFHDGKYPFEEYPYLVVTQGLKKTAYMFSLYEAVNGYDLQWTDKIEITDETGNELEGKIKVDKDSFVRAMHMLAWGYEQEECIGKTEKFKEKYPYFLDLFIHYSPLEFNQITFIEELSSFEKNEAYFEVDSNLECKKRTYVVKLTLDKFNFIDDADVKLRKEMAYEPTSGRHLGAALFYINSNLANLNIGNNLIIKYTKMGSIFQDINLIDLNNQYGKEICEINESEDIVKLKLSNGEYKYYLCKYQYGKDWQIDDIQYKELNYDDKDIKKVKSLYLQSLEDK